MKLIEALKKVFRKRELSNYEKAIRIIKKMGYRKDGTGNFIKYSQAGETMIWFQNGGVKIKVYGFSYAESDFLPESNLTPEKLINFIKANQL